VPLDSAGPATYCRLMTKLLETTLEGRRPPAEAQDDIARAMLQLARSEEEPDPIEPDHLSAILEGLAQADRREFATDAEVEAAFRRFG
jgi:hypothetical protein